MPSDGAGSSRSSYSGRSAAGFPTKGSSGEESLAHSAESVRDVRVAGSSQPAVAADGLGDEDVNEQLLRRIAECRTLRDVEMLLYELGSWFRSEHAAELLIRLPELDLGGSNSGPRTRQLIRFLTHGSLHNVEEVGGPALARCVAAYARLHYAPPEAVPQICTALLSYYSRKLRSCQGPELADLAWGLASLQLLYGDMHQAIKRPAYTARLAPGARIVGYVRAQSDSDRAAATATIAIAADGSTGTAPAAALEGGGGSSGGADQAMVGGAEVEASAAAATAAITGDSPATGAAASATKRKRRKAQRDALADSEAAESAVLVGAEGGGGGGGKAVAAAGGRKAQQQQDQIWMVPVAME
ncbi:hypothetical protein Agub_g3137, partial [Astrephomene gubernaculifera]